MEQDAKRRGAHAPSASPTRGPSLADKMSRGVVRRPGASPSLRPVERRSKSRTDAKAKEPRGERPPSLVENADAEPPSRPKGSPAQVFRVVPGACSPPTPRQKTPPKGVKRTPRLSPREHFTARPDHPSARPVPMRNANKASMGPRTFSGSSTLLVSGSSNFFGPCGTGGTSPHPPDSPTVTPVSLKMRGAGSTAEGDWHQSTRSMTSLSGTTTPTESSDVPALGVRSDGKPQDSRIMKLIGRRRSVLSTSLYNDVQQRRREREQRCGKTAVPGSPVQTTSRIMQGLADRGSLVDHSWLASKTGTSKRLPPKVPSDAEQQAGGRKDSLGASPSMRKSIDRQERDFLDKSDLAPRTDETLGCREGGESSYPEHPVLDETASKEAVDDPPESEGSAANVTEADEALEALPAQDSAQSASMDDDVKVIWPGLPLSARTEPSDGPATVELHSEQQPPGGTWSWAQAAASDIPASQTSLRPETRPPQPPPILQNEVGSLVVSETWQYVLPPALVAASSSVSGAGSSTHESLGEQRDAARVTGVPQAPVPSAAGLPRAVPGAREADSTAAETLVPMDIREKRRLLADLVSVAASRVNKAEHDLSSEQRANHSMRVTLEVLQKQNLSLQQQVAWMSQGWSVNNAHTA
uniref:Uncharacterized protein n=1 Tax=Noctiluca scintillans TaxID=2966 RepID=A0A7S1FFU1_NOCSC